MGGWPSTTGNPSGGGRWNNEEDDGYDDNDDEGYTPVNVYTGPSHFQLQQNRAHNDRLDAQDRDAIRDAYNSNKERQKLYNQAEQLKSKVKKIAYVGESDYIAREYFGEESYEALLDTILRPLAETCHKITVMKNDRSRGANLLDIMQYPKLSKDDHILITEGYTYWAGGKYLFKSDWNDDSEDLTLVNPGRSLEIITSEDIQAFHDKKQEFLGLLAKKDEATTRVLGYYTLFNGEEWLRHARLKYDPDWRPFLLKDQSPFGRLHTIELDKYKPTSGPLKDIKDAIDNDILEMNAKMKKLNVRLGEIKAAYEKDVSKYSNRW